MSRKSPPPPPRPSSPASERPTEDLPHRIDRMIEDYQAKRYAPPDDPFAEPEIHVPREDPVISSDDLVTRPSVVEMSADERASLWAKRDQLARARHAVIAVAGVLERMAAVLRGIFR